MGQWGKLRKHLNHFPLGAKQYVLKVEVILPRSTFCKHTSKMRYTGTFKN